jgi:hypothetical protein
LLKTGHFYFALTLVPTAVLPQNDNVLLVQIRNVLLLGYSPVPKDLEEYGQRGHYQDEFA